MASSLQKLKGKSLSEELGAAEASAPIEEQETDVSEETEEVVVDVEKMTAKQLDELVAEHGIEVPEEWAKMKKPQKVAWLEAKFSDDGEEEASEEADAEEAEDETEEEAAEEPAEAEEEEVEEEAPAPAKTKAKPAKGKVNFGKKAAAPEPEEETEDEAVAEEPAKPAKGKVAVKAKAPTSKAVAKSTAKSGELLSPDTFSTTVAEIESLKEKDALQLVDRLSEANDFTCFKLGGVLHRIQQEEWFKSNGYANFREYVEKHHNIGYRKAMYWVAIYTDIIDSGVSYEKVSHIGWTKLKEIASILTPENVDEWVELAEKHNVQNLIALVNQTKAGDNEEVQGKLSNANANVTSTMAFKLHADQKEVVEAAIDKAKKEADTEVNSVALEFICLAYTSAGKTKMAKAPDPKTVLQKMGLEDAANLLGEAFPEATINIEA